MFMALINCDLYISALPRIGFYYALSTDRAGQPPVNPFFEARFAKEMVAFSAYYFVSYIDLAR